MHVKGEVKYFHDFLKTKGIAFLAMSLFVIFSHQSFAGAPALACPNLTLSDPTAVAFPSCACNPATAAVTNYNNVFADTCGHPTSCAGTKGAPAVTPTPTPATTPLGTPVPYPTPVGGICKIVVQNICQYGDCTATDGGGSYIDECLIDGCTASTGSAGPPSYCTGVDNSATMCPGRCTSGSSITLYYGSDCSDTETDYTCAPAATPTPTPGCLAPAQIACYECSGAAGCVGLPPPVAACTGSTASTCCSGSITSCPGFTASPLAPGWVVDSVTPSGWSCAVYCN